MYKSLHSGPSDEKEIKMFKKRALNYLIMQYFGVRLGFLILQILPPWENTAFYFILAWFHGALEHELRTPMSSVLGRGQALSLIFS